LSGKSVRQQFADTMLDVGQKDQNLVVLVGDISHFALQPFAKVSPERYYNVGICEPTMMSMSAGLSAQGFHPVAHTIAPFLIERSFEQIKLDFCYQELGGNLVTVGSAFDYATLGCTHHCYDDFALIKTLPGTEVVYPGSAVEFDSLFKQVYANDALSMFRVPAAVHDVEFGPNDIQFGKGIKIAEGSDVTVIATGPQLANALAAREKLVGRGWDPEIIYIHTIKPLDVELVRASVEKTRRVLVIEEHARSGGLNEDVLRATYDIDGMRFSALTIPDAFIHGYGTYEEQCAALGLSKDGIVQRITSEFAGA
jgi:transketolase